MRRRQEWRGVFSVMAAIAGTGLIPGRALALFFGQFKSAMWAGMIVAAAWFGAIVALLLRYRSRCREALQSGESASGVGRVAMLLGEVFSALIISMMLARAGEIGALTLPVRHGYAWGAALALTLALATGVLRDEAQPAFGAAVLLGTMLFYAALAMDTRPVRLRIMSQTELRLAGNARVAALFGALFASMNGCAAMLGGRTPAGAARPIRMGERCGAALMAVLVLGGLALRRGGDALLALAMPWAALSARWGLAGFWLCAALEYLCAVSTLSAMLNGILGHVTTGGRAGSAALCALLLSLVLFAVLSWGRF